MCKEKQTEMMFGLQVSSGALHCELLCDPVNAAVVDRSTAGPKVQDGSGAESRTSCICNIETSCYRLAKIYQGLELKREAVGKVQLHDNSFIQLQQKASP
jgi:hypothetical protein